MDELESLVIRRALPGDLPYLKMLADEVFGKNYHLDKTFIPDQILVSEIKDKIIGFCSWTFNTPYQPNGLLKTKTWTLLDMRAVLPEFQGNGIGKQLFRKRLDTLTKNGSQKLLLYHWKTKSHPSARLALSLGFRLDKEIEGFWGESNRKKRSTCPECKKVSCSCSVLIYLRIS